MGNLCERCISTRLDINQLYGEIQTIITGQQTVVSCFGKRGEKVVIPVGGGKTSIGTVLHIGREQSLHTIYQGIEYNIVSIPEDAGSIAVKLFCQLAGIAETHSKTLSFSR